MYIVCVIDLVYLCWDEKGRFYSMTSLWLCLIGAVLSSKNIHIDSKTAVSILRTL